MKELERKVRLIEMDGLVWGAGELGEECVLSYRILIKVDLYVGRCLLRRN